MSPRERNDRVEPMRIGERIQLELLQAHMFLLLVLQHQDLEDVSWGGEGQ